jgi:glycosyltransferase involved in cell wall biosynthesis
MRDNAKWLAQLIRDEKVDIVHARSRAPAWSAYWACKSTGCKFVTTFHAVYHFSNPFKKFYNSVMAKGCRVIAISRYVAIHIMNAYGLSSKKIRTIYRGIDTDRFSVDRVTEDRKKILRDTWGVGEGDRIVLLPGRLSPIKGHDLAIEAMSVLPEDLDDVRLVLMGDLQGRDEYKVKLEKLVASRKLSGRVIFAPHSPDMPAAYSLAQIVLMPSKVAEGFGRVPVEAMAMGVPVIASNLGPTRETVMDGETGWLVPPEDPVQWSEILTNALRRTPQERDEMSAKARLFIEEHFTKSVMVASTLAVYDEVMK